MPPSCQHWLIVATDWILYRLVRFMLIREAKRRHESKASAIRRPNKGNREDVS
jgi:hypothetical protein